MSDKLYPLPVEKLLKMVLEGLERGSIFGVYKSLFFQPDKKDWFKTSVFHQMLDTPIGLAAGPHTQMAQNIIAGWLCGARYIELKTVQTLDEINVSKPCIDMSDEGYNCEWSQELKIHESYEEYLKAWIIIHVLQHELQMSPSGTLFNMSVGYDMKGILQTNVQWFFQKMTDCTEEKSEMLDEISEFYPSISQIIIPDKISNNITLSTMHGCPSGEIEKIGHYLLTEKQLHTFIKLNPTLLGQQEINEILQQRNYKTQVPAVAFEHDIQYSAACDLIESLQKTADETGLVFGIKLTNTLESINNKNIFSDQSMYMSGKALHPISINVARKLRQEFPKLTLSYCGGVTARNLDDVLKCGFNPVTVCSDILKPGGYMRLLQYLENISPEYKTVQHDKFLKNYAERVKTDQLYDHEIKNIKSGRNLEAFDCISAPCIDKCPTHQNIPAYLDFVANDKPERALETILETNPFPASTGMVCDHSCQSKCTRINYDSAIRIRDIKRHIAENVNTMHRDIAKKLTDQKVAIIGAGPSGLSCGYFLTLWGCNVNVYETKDIAGGMIANAIPDFRLTEYAVEYDIKRIEEAGVKIHYSSKIDLKKFEQLRLENDFVYIAVGAQKATEANIPGQKNVTGLLDPLKFLSNVKKLAAESPAVYRADNLNLGENVIVLGGGNTAIDVARTARRLVGKEGKVTIVYRRTRNEMPAEQSEIDAALEENIQLIELAAPARVLSKNGQITALLCHRMQLEQKSEYDRPKPVIIPEKEFDIPCDTIIPAFGQQLDVNFVDPELLQTRSQHTLETQLDNVFIGGDANRGASFLIKAVADGKNAAREILAKLNQNWNEEKTGIRASREEHHKKLSRIIPGMTPKTIPVEERNYNTIVELSMTPEEVKFEAGRCLNCDEICDICITVCPNRANMGYEVEPFELDLQKILVRKGNPEILGDDQFKISQKYQILNIADFCNECGNCTTFCPTSGRPFADKPKIALTELTFFTLEEGYFVQENAVLYKENHQVFSLIEATDNYQYSGDNFAITLDKDFKILNMDIDDVDELEISLRDAVKMKVIGDGIKGILL
ncbi:MAG: FAD-dependent oxidoreductase [Candidatus Marinimicrobia bacterium]|nr:FAD-dependent oxidoreductase [Candidatus Neomarinimicrobiota bacterium]